MVTLLQPRIEANCTALRTGNEREVGTVKKRIQTWVNAESDEAFLKTLSNCSHIVEEYSNNFYVSPEEENFPLAYILVVHNNVRQVLRLLKVIYRPHNLYCIHPDAKEPNLVEHFRPFPAVLSIYLLHQSWKKCTIITTVSWMLS